MKQPEAPLPDGPFENLLAFVGAWIAIIGLAGPAYLIGSPWAGSSMWARCSCFSASWSCATSTTR
jgi:hypothetical protein